ncbi:MAG: DUF2341 domain-containing protein [Myxococcales bacterium]|nr:DUF2341 domain-containing protein [Myxococcales bacterium]
MRDPPLVAAAALTLGCVLANPAYDVRASASESGTTSASTSGSTTAGVDDWWDPAWRHRRPLIIHNPTAETLIDPPIALFLTPDRLDFASAAADGGDLRVVADDGALLDHAIERWSADPAALVWIRAPELPPGDTPLWLYWDNPDAPPVSGEVFAASYDAVFHLADRLIDDLTIADATGAHGGHAYPTMGPASALAGRLGGALRFAGVAPDGISGDFIDVDAPPIESDLWPGLTLEAWVLHAQRGEHRILSKATSTKPADHVVALGVHDNAESGDTALYLRLAVDDGLVQEYQSELLAIPHGAEARWVHVAATWDGAEVRLYVDGAAAPSRHFEVDDTYVEAHPLAGASLRDGAQALAIANVNDLLLDPDEARYWIGDLDEIRLAARAHTPAWIEVQHRSMIDALVDYSGAIESSP